ncbi:MAG TPA: carboxypeptidase-like regulatory domain-containing protein, partial [Labilithrix sp.]|nr:carboxypeptidase-like regulatory domain-containing protein [Labilithrix sp.]
IYARSLVLRRPLPFLLSALALGLVAGCDDGNGSSTSNSSSTSSSSSGSGGAGGQDESFRLSGSLSYESVPFDVDLEKLDYGKIEKRPIRGASVRLIDADTDAEIAKTTSDDEGAYSFDYTGAAKVKVWVYTQTEVPSLTVEDNTSGDEVYVMESNTADSAVDAKLDVLAATGWDGTAYTKTRAAAPFAVLDTAYTAARRFLDEVSPTPVFPPLKFNWSINNRPEDGDKALGQVGTSHFDGEELYILGKEDVDTDEFDSHITVHEWGHWFDRTLGRADTIGGNHAAGDIEDPRVAWSEGFCTGLSAIILDPDTTYTDSSGPGQASGFANDVEINNNDVEANPGWFSETTVEGLVYDLYDGPNEPFDQVSVGIKGIYEAHQSQKSKASFTTIFSFVASLKENNPQAAPDIDALTSFYNVSADFGLDPIEDEWGTNETHAGGFTGSLPVYKEGVVGNSVAVELTGDAESNRLSQNVYVRIEGDGMAITVTSTSPSDVDLSLFNAGVLVTSDGNASGEESLTFDSEAGTFYVLSVRGYNTMPVSYGADITISH